MRFVQFLEYRRHDETRTEANNAIMALLAGAHLAAHTLQLTQGSDKLLPEIYPQVPHIKRFNLLTTAAQDLLNDAEVHLGAMAVPYILAIQEDFVVTALNLVNADVRKLNASNMHQRLASAIGVTYGSALSSFQAARLLRNCIIHNGDQWNTRSRDEAKNHVKASDVAEWVKHTNRSILNLAPGDRVTVGNGELVATLSATKTLAKAINHALQPALSRDSWADLLIEDIQASQPTHLTDHQQVRKCAGYAKHLYGPPKLTTTEIRDALSRAGY